MAKHLISVIEEFCDDHNTSVSEDNADYDLNAETFGNWCDATANEDAKALVPDNQTLRGLMAEAGFPELANQVAV